MGSGVRSWKPSLTFLPYWSSDIDIEVTQSLPWGLDYRPVNGGTFFKIYLKFAAAHCMRHGSELLFIASHDTGCVGTAVNDVFYMGASPGVLNPGFIMLLAYSESMEHIIVRAILNYYRNSKDDERHELIAGITHCSLWDNKKLVSSVKTIAVTSSELFFDPEDFLKIFMSVVSDKYADCLIDNAPYYAEKFGYKRFNMLYDTDDPYRTTVSRLLHNIELDCTREIVGSKPEVDFPEFIAEGRDIRDQRN